MGLVFLIRWCVGFFSGTNECSGSKCSSSTQRYHPNTAGLPLWTQVGDWWLLKKDECQNVWHTNQAELKNLNGSEASPLAWWALEIWVSFAAAIVWKMLSSASPQLVLGQAFSAGYSPALPYSLFIPEAGLRCWISQLLLFTSVFLYLDGCVKKHDFSHDSFPWFRPERLNILPPLLIRHRENVDSR